MIGDVFIENTVAELIKVLKHKQYQGLKVRAAIVGRNGIKWVPIHGVSIEDGYVSLLTEIKVTF